MTTSYPAAPPITRIDLTGHNAIKIGDGILTSDAWLRARKDPAIAYALINLLRASISQVPAASVPFNDDLLESLSGCDTATWARIKPFVMSSWTLCSDDRYYNADVSRYAIEIDEARAKKAAISEINAAKGRASAASRALATPVNRSVVAAPKKSKIAAAAALIENPAAPAVTSVSLPATVVYDISEKLSREEEIFNHWRDVMKSPRSVLDAKRKKLISSRLKDGYTPQDMMLAIDGCRATPHNMGSTNGTLYNTIELILRDSSYIDRFMSTAKGTKDLFASPTDGLSDKSKKNVDEISKWLNREKPPGDMGADHA